MKKSEMLKIIEDKISDLIHKYPPNDYPPDAVMAKHILEAVEDAGMLPPIADVPGNVYRDNYWERE
jgi:hypothetical protein